MKSVKNDDRMLVIYFGALVGAFIGAKLAFMVAEGWLYQGENAWRYWLVGKSVTGALLGGFLGVELMKKFVKYTKATGDKFALIIPLGIITGRLGCLSHGCCGGVLLENGQVWPAVPVEIGYNLLIWLLIYILHRIQLLKNQLFHLYLISYGIFRFFHEFMRTTPKLVHGLSGYQYIALALAFVGFFAYAKRSRKYSKFPLSKNE